VTHHLPAPLHQGPAGPRPGDPPPPRARLALSCSGKRPTRSLSAMPTCPISARSTSCDRSAPYAHTVSALSATDERPASQPGTSVHPAFGACRRKSGGGSYVRGMAVWEARRSGGPFVRNHDQTSCVSKPRGSAARPRPTGAVTLRPSGPFPGHHVRGDQTGEGCPHGLVRGVLVRRPGRDPRGRPRTVISPRSHDIARPRQNQRLLADPGAMRRSTSTGWFCPSSVITELEPSATIRSSAPSPECAAPLDECGSATGRLDAAVPSSTRAGLSGWSSTTPTPRRCFRVSCLGEQRHHDSGRPPATSPQQYYVPWSPRPADATIRPPRSGSRAEEYTPSDRRSDPGYIAWPARGARSAPRRL